MFITSVTHCRVQLTEKTENTYLNTIVSTQALRFLSHFLEKRVINDSANCMEATLTQIPAQRSERRFELTFLPRNGRTRGN